MSTHPEPSVQSSLPHTVISIDGPAASGKSTVARVLSKRLGYAYVNTGAMYRAVTWLVAERGVNPSDPEAVNSLLDSSVLEFGVENGQSTICINGVDPSEHLAAASVNSTVSLVASIPHVRQVLVARQREFARDYDIVMEGRDIGSVVFPETPLKFYVDASPEVRAQRRALQGHQDDLAARDKIDSTRRTSPLVIPSDACLIDSSHLTPDGVVSEIIARLKLKGLPIVE